jgi:hypothetical protein
MWCGKYLPDAVYASAGNGVQRVLVMFARSDLFVVGCVVRSGEAAALQYVRGDGSFCLRNSRGVK